MYTYLYIQYRSAFHFESVHRERAQVISKRKIERCICCVAAPVSLKVYVRVMRKKEDFWVWMSIMRLDCIYTRCTNRRRRQIAAISV